MSVQQENFRTIADKIREKTNKTELIKPIEFANKIDEVYDAGKNAEYDTFWDNFQDYGNRTDYDHAFFSKYWNDNTFKPKYSIKLTNGSWMFCYSTMTEIPSIDCTALDELSRTYYYANGAVNIGTVVLKEDGSQTFFQTFNGCSKLVNVTFEGKIGSSVFFGVSSKLTSASIDNIIEHLKDLTGDEAQTITFHSNVVNNLTEAQLETIKNKNWIVG